MKHRIVCAIAPLKTFKTGQKQSDPLTEIGLIVG